MPNSMQIRGESSLPAPPTKVWEALTDPAVLSLCIDSCDNLERLTPTLYRAEATVKMGILRSPVGINLALTDVDSPTAWTIKTTAKSRFGTATATTNITVAACDGGSVLAHETSAELSGQLAFFSGRGAESAIERALEDFFARLKQFLQTTEQEGSETPALDPVADPPPETEPATNKPEKTKLWIGLSATAVVALAASILVAQRRRQDPPHQ